MAKPSKLTDEQKAALNEYTDEYKLASSKERKRLLKEALAALFPRASDDDNEEKKEQMERLRKVGSLL